MLISEENKWASKTERKKGRKDIFERITREIYNRKIKDDDNDDDDDYNDDDNDVDDNNNNNFE